MSSTRHAAASGPLRQERYASSEAYKTSLGGLLVAKRCSVLRHDPDLVNLLWFIQDQSLPDTYGLGNRAGSVEALAEALLREADFKPYKGRRTTLVEVIESKSFMEEVPVTDADAAAECNRVATDLGRALCELALNPDAVPESLPGLGHAWRQVLTTHRNRRRDQVKAGLAATSVTKTVIDTLRFSRDVGKPTLTDGRSRLGKSAAAKAFCAGSGGLARYILTPEDNDMVTLYRVCAKALGVADSPSKKAADVRELVERTLITSRLMLVFDEAQNLFSSSARVTKQPNRVLWLRRLIDAGVPMAFVALPDIERRIMRCVEHVGFDAAQFTDLICRRSSLPLNLCGADFAILVERLASDLSASSKRSIAAAANGQQGAQYVIDVLAVARHNAAKAGRERPNDEDVQAAIGDRPTFVYAPGIAPRKRGRPGRAPTQAQARPIAMPPPADPATLVRHSRTASARTVQESLTA